MKGVIVNKNNHLGTEIWEVESWRFMYIFFSVSGGCHPQASYWNCGDVAEGRSSTSKCL